MKYWAIVSPCFNESDLIEQFLKSLEKTLSDSTDHYTIVIVDDASTDGSLDVLKTFTFNSDNFELEVISLNFNTGHQGAIREGLIYASTLEEELSGVIVMDSDGEDDPAAIMELTKMEDFEIVFVRRGKRKESALFKIGYFFYKIIFRIITGKAINFGNFSLLSSKVLQSIAGQQFFHYAAFLSKTKFKKDKIQFDRKSRLGGKSKMNFGSLILHGMKSLIEYAEEVLYFLIKVFLFIFLVFLIFGAYVLYQRIFTDNAILGWASTIGINLFIACLLNFSVILLSISLLSIKNSMKLNEVRHKKIR